jgi:hypothetical protein
LISEYFSQLLIKGDGRRGWEGGGGGRWNNDKWFFL